MSALAVYNLKFVFMSVNEEPLNDKSIVVGMLLYALA